LSEAQFTAEFSFDPEFEELEEISGKAKSTDITLELYGLAWASCRKIPMAA
jgi:hypothetical protein